MLVLVPLKVMHVLLLAGRCSHYIDHLLFCIFDDSLYNFKRHHCIYIYVFFLYINTYIKTTNSNNLLSKTHAVLMCYGLITDLNDFDVTVIFLVYLCVVWTKYETHRPRRSAYSLFNVHFVWFKKKVFYPFQFGIWSCKLKTKH